MSELEQAWSSWRAHLAQTADTETLRRALLQTAAQMRARSAGSTGLAKEWQALGVHVARARLASSGTCSERDGRRLVLLAKGESPARQRFTAAHEAAHLLLGALEPGRLSHGQEERLCDEFASAYLIDRLLLARRIREVGLPREPLAVLSLCSSYRVNVQPMLIALGEHLIEQPVLLIASRERPHPVRPHELDMRIDAAAGHGRIFLPRHKRLRTQGLQTLADWALRAPLHAECHGEDHAALRARLAAAPVFPGCVRWHARMQGERPRFMLAAIEVQDLLQAPVASLARAA